MPLRDDKPTGAENHLARASGETDPVDDDGLGPGDANADPLSPSEAGRSRDESRTPRSRAGRRQRRRRRWKIVGVSALVLLLAVTAGVALALHRLEGNVHSVVLSGRGANAAKQDGRALNILLIGSDSRASAQDCKLGGACAKTAAAPSSSSSSTSSASSSSSTPPDTQAANADVEMLIHLAADRKHAEVVSIPRDTIVDVPACNDGTISLPARRDRINSSMQAGIDCTVRSVEHLTGLDVEHVAVVDFHGVVTLSNALGGVPVCVDKDVYDPYSKLKLKAGTHEVKGTSALEFVRTRHGFGNGGDLGRTGAQHLFLSSLIRQVRSTSVLTDPLKLYDVADAATKALTVDQPIASASGLISLVRDLDSVPSDKITFVTMPTTPDPLNRNVLVTTPQTSVLFDELKRDEPLASPSASASPSTSHASSSPASASASPEVPDGQPARVQASSTGCATVSTHLTVAIDGRAMTPTQAYAASPNVPDSAD